MVFDPSGRPARLLLLSVLNVAVTSSLVTASFSQAIPVAEEIVDLSPPNNPWMKDLGDLDGDAQIDLVVAGRDGPVVWYAYPDWTRHRIAASIGSGGSTTGIDVADIDLDGDLDVAIANGRWFENPRPDQPATTLDWTEHIIDGATGHDIFMVDLDGDGDIDAVKRNQGSDGDLIRLFRRDGLDDWSPNVLTVPTGEGLGVADLDADGDLDLIISGRWYENTGDIIGGPWTEHIFTTGYQEADVVVATGLINSDNRLDIVLSPAESSGQISTLTWFEAPVDPNSEFAAHVIQDPVESVVHGLQLGDFNLDGRLDVATAQMHQGADPDHVKIHFNDGNGAAWTPQLLSAEGSHTIRVGDIDGDGDPDLFGANHSEGAPDGAPVKLWRNNQVRQPLALDQWSRHLIDDARPSRAIFVTSGDVSGDGLPDVVAGGWWYRNPGTSGSNWQRNELGASLNNLAALADFDGNETLDALGTAGLGSNPNADFSYASNDGAGNFTVVENVISGEGDFLQGVAIDRFTGGSLQAALSWHVEGAGLQMLSVPADPITGTWQWELISGSSQDEQISASDIDRDGRVDLLLGTIWLRNTTAGWVEHTLFETNDKPDRNRLADINGDGRIDAVVGYEAISTVGVVAWYEQPLIATDPWTEHLIANVIGPMSLDVGDVDADGDFDVVVGEHNLSSPSSAALFVFENADNSGDAWLSHTVYVGDEHHDGAQLVDIDLDGDLDIVSTGWGSNDIVLYENRALGGAPPVSVCGNGAAEGPEECDDNGDSALCDADCTLASCGDGYLNTQSAESCDDGGISAACDPDCTPSLCGDAFVNAVAGEQCEPSDDAACPAECSGCRCPATPPGNLLAHWPFDEGTGTTAADVSGNGHHGTTSGATWTSGQLAGALFFDGIDDYLDVSSLSSASSELSVTAWLNAESFGATDARVISNSTGTQESDHDFMVSTISNGGEIRLRLRLRTGGTTKTLIGNAPVEAGQWTHVALSYDGAMLRLYQDGSDVGSMGMTGDVGDVALVTHVGRNPDGYGPFHGRIDDVRVYAVGLDRAQVLEVMAGRGQCVLDSDCDDADACNGEEVCSAGTCQPGTLLICDDENACTIDSCDPGSGCLSSDDTASCDDGNVCTDDSCDPGAGCIRTNNTAGCGDDNACNGDEICSAGSCQAGTPPVCDDGNACTDDSCDPGSGCLNTDNTASCGEGDACTGDAFCSAGVCQPGTLLTCDDGNVCTDDSCDPDSGCLNTDNTASCGDGDACNGDEVCSASICHLGAPLICNDGNICTDDGCDPGSGCFNTDNTAGCGDGNACNGDEVCAARSCQPGGSLVCDDGNVCTDDSCDPGSGCIGTDNSASCGDDDACNGDEVCSAGICQSGTPLVCDDGNVCTDDSCDPGSGCLNNDNTASCGDGDACNGDEVCAAGVCQPGTSLICDDNIQCTDDSCDPAAGCLVIDNGAGCDDGNLCTDDSCDTESGCVSSPNTGSCSDGDACNGDEVCAAGICQPGIPPIADDGVLCTLDSCDPVAGITHVPTNSLCDDQVFCNGNEVCDPINGCQSGVEPCLGRCSNDTDSCDEDLLAHWPFDEGSGTETADVSGNGHHAATSGLGWVAGQLGNALFFDGTDDYLDVSGVSSASPEFSVTAWFNAEGFGVADARLISKSSGQQEADHDFMVSTFSRAGEIRLRVRLRTGGTTHTLVGTAAVLARRWTHVALSYDGATLRLYQDGSVGASKAMTGAVGDLALHTHIGRNPDGYAPFHGSIDDVRIYAIGLSSAQVLNIIAGASECLLNSECGDGNACNGAEVCAAGLCQAGTSPNCDDDNVCTDDSCDPGTGCFSTNNTASCADRDLCNGDEICSAGICQPGTPLACNDGPLLAHWPFDEGAGTRAADVSGHGHHGSSSGTSWIAGQLGGALLFDGSDDYLDVSSISSASPELSVTAWFRAESFGVSDARLISNSTGTKNSDHDFMLSTVFRGGEIRLRVRLRTGGTTQTLIGTEPVTAGRWTHVALSYDGTMLRLYQDGSVVGSLAMTGPVGDEAPATYIGLNPDGYGPFHGAIDDVRVYRVGLDTAEVLGVMAAGGSMFQPLVAVPALPNRVGALALAFGLVALGYAAIRLRSRVSRARS